MYSSQTFTTISVVNIYKSTISCLNSFADSIPPLILRLILAWEFGEAGFEKFYGTNWFGELSFPFPFSLLPPEISWKISMFFEIAGAIALLLGIATRFFSISLIILTIVAIATVHWPEQISSFTDLIKGYRIADEAGDGFGNYKLPLIYIVMLLPLLFAGAGKLSGDYLLTRKFGWQSQ